MLKHPLLFSLVAALSVSGCASFQEVALDPDMGGQLSGRMLQLTERGQPAFSASTAGKAMFGALGAVADMASGNRIIAENEVADPAVQIADRLAEHLSDRLVVAVSGDRVGAPGDKNQDAMKLGDDLVLDVVTTNWGYIYFPANWSRYRVYYSARATLLDTRSQTLLADGVCFRMPDRTEDSPTLDELLANNAEGLKLELQTAADYCVEEFLTNAFST